MKALRIAGRIVGTTVTAAMILLILTVLGLGIAQRRSADGVPHVAGHMVLNVLSGSMTPVFLTGDAVLDSEVTPLQAEHLKVGQIVTYKTTQFFHGQSMLITHRIVGIFTITSKQTGQAQRLYVTKGDANNAIDNKPVAPAQIIGVYDTRLPYLGYISSFTHSALGFILLVAVPFLYLIGSLFLSLWRQLDEKERREKDDALALAQGGDGPH